MYGSPAQLAIVKKVESLFNNLLTFIQPARTNGTI